jgi:hypothetical protein
VIQHDKYTPVLVYDDGWTGDIVVTWQLLPQVNTCIQVTILKVTLGYLSDRNEDIFVRIPGWSHTLNIL